jgi:hypothetical protein
MGWSIAILIRMCFRAVTVVTVVGFLRLSDPYFAIHLVPVATVASAIATLGSERLGLRASPRLAGLIEGGWVKSGG